jgi:hypothetical protein
MQASFTRLRSSEGGGRHRQAGIAHHLRHRVPACGEARQISADGHEASPDKAELPDQYSGECEGREQLKQTGAMEGLFRRFDAVLAAKGFLAMGG